LTIETYIPKENPYLSTNYSRQSCFLSLQELNALVLHGIGIIPISHKLYFFLAIPFQTSKWDNCPKSSLWYIWFTSSKQISKQNPSISFQDIHKWLSNIFKFFLVEIMSNRNLLLVFLTSLAILWHSLILLQNSEKFNMIDVAVSPILIHATLRGTVSI